MTGDGRENVAYYDALAPMYHLFFQDFDQSMQKEGAWLHRILAEGAVCRTVLDACCGTGRQAIPLAQQGYTVTAADPSAPMLEQARENASRRRLDIRFLLAPFADLPRRLATDFDAVVALGNGLTNLSTREGIGEALAALRACCRDGGICVIGIKDFESLMRDRPRLHVHRAVDTSEGRAVLFELWNYDDPILAITGFLLQSDTLTGESWEPIVAETREYMLLPEELVQMAHEAGFSRVYRLAHPTEAAFLLQA